MLNQNINKYLIFIFFCIFIALVSAYFIQYSLGYQPCKLCIYARIPYFIAIFLLIIILLNPKYQKTTLLILSIVFLCGVFLSFYHFGIEQGFFTESFVCESKSLSKSLSKEQLLEQLKQNNVSCKDISFTIVGLSLATINMVLSFILSLVFLILFINYREN
jgi:disulfide bond formation protein DsbB|tara:strand:- start:490 stop:972 length:483 start_codon:yes stop_codon:yes gene_type:complete